MSRPSWVARWRKFLPQIAYVLLAGWTLIADRLDNDQTIDGVTVMAVIVAIAQATAVAVPGHADVKAGASLVAAVAQGVTAAWSDRVITAAEYTVLVSAFLAWAAGAAVTNHPPDPPADEPLAPPLLPFDVPDHLPDLSARIEGAANEVTTAVDGLRADIDALKAQDVDTTALEARLDSLQAAADSLAALDAENPTAAPPAPEG